MQFRLLVLTGPDRGRVLSLPETGTFVIGRGRETDSRLTDPHVSRAHCQIRTRDNRYVISDLNSIAGTLVNGKPLTEEHYLLPGDVITVGETQLKLQIDDAADLETIAPSRVGAHIPMASLVPEAEEEEMPEALPADEEAEAEEEDLPATPPSKRTVAQPPTTLPPPSFPHHRMGELTGHVLAHFEVGPVIAKGQSGVVFRARDQKTGRVVALKVLRPEFARDAHSVQRFIRSMKTVLPLRHPNLVTLHGAGKKGPYCWVAMELIEGESLTQVIQRIGVAGMLDWRHAFRVAVHLGRALSFAHERHIVHRNLTAQNVLVRSSDKATRLGDLMLAKALQGQLAEDLTRPDEMLGDLRFMAPERTRGPDELDERSDLYGLGALVYALLTGKPPCEGANTVETILKIRTDLPVPPKRFQMSIPDAFQDAVLRLLAKRPEDRFQTANDLLTELNRIGKLNAVAV